MDPILFARCDPVETFGVAPAAMEAAEAPVVVWEALDGEPRPSLDGIGGVVLFGSSYNVEHADQQPFIKDARELTLEAIDRGVPYLGVCFGAQLLAWSLDADVMKAPVREVGFEAIRPDRCCGRRPSALALRRRRPGVPVAHGHVRRCPTAATLLATGRPRDQPGVSRGRPHLGRAVPLRDRSATELDLWLDAFEREDGPLESSWGKTAATIRAEADRYLAAHEASRQRGVHAGSRRSAARSHDERIGRDGGYRPLVAVVAYHLAHDRVARWPHGGYGVPAPYIEALRRAGARTAIVSPGEPGEPEEILEPFDGLMLVGGGDVDPARYGAEPDTTHNYGVEPDRDAFEIELLLAAERMRVPALCICRGMQVMNVAYGGTLHQHLPDMPGLLRARRAGRGHARRCIRSRPSRPRTSPRSPSRATSRARRITTRAWTASATGCA